MSRYLPTDLADTQQHVYDQLEARDSETCDSFAEHCENWLGKDHTKPLLLAIIEMDDTPWLRLMAHIEGKAPDLHKALSGIVDHIERNRTDFIAEEALTIIRNSRGEAA